MATDNAAANGTPSAANADGASDSKNGAPAYPMKLFVRNAGGGSGVVVVADSTTQIRFVETKISQAFNKQNTEDEKLKCSGVMIRATAEFDKGAFHEFKLCATDTLYDLFHGQQNIHLFAELEPAKKREASKPANAQIKKPKTDDKAEGAGGQAGPSASAPATAPVAAPVTAPAAAPDAPAGTTAKKRGRPSKKDLEVRAAREAAVAAAAAAAAQVDGKGKGPANPPAPAAAPAVPNPKAAEPKKKKSKGPVNGVSAADKKAQREKGAAEATKQPAAPASKADARSAEAHKAGPSQKPAKKPAAAAAAAAKQPVVESDESSDEESSSEVVTGSSEEEEDEESAAPGAAAKAGGQDASSEGDSDESDSDEDDE